MRGIRELDVMLIFQGCHLIGEVNIANIKCLERVDRMGIGVDRPGLQFQVRTATLCDVTHPADSDIPASIRRVVAGRQRIVAVLATLHLCDGAVEVIVKCIGAKVKGSGRSIERKGHTICIFQRRA